MHDHNQNQEDKLFSDKSLLVASFLAVILFMVLATVVAMVNRSEDYTDIQSHAGENVR